MSATNVALAFVASDVSALRSSVELAKAAAAVKISSSTRSSSPAMLAADASASIASCSTTSTRSFGADQRRLDNSVIKPSATAPTRLPNSSEINAAFAFPSRDGSVSARRTAIFVLSTSATKKSSELRADALFASAPLTAASSQTREATSDLRLLPPK